MYLRLRPKDTEEADEWKSLTCTKYQRSREGEMQEMASSLRLDPRVTLRTAEFGINAQERRENSRGR